MVSRGLECLHGFRLMYDRDFGGQSSGSEWFRDVYKSLDGFSTCLRNLERFELVRGVLDGIRF